jgi:asparagine synthase (glutamine-hydrolysing)
MCGIAGFYDFNCQSSKEVLVKMTDALIHRGPDDSGYEVIENDNYQVGLGHRRLSILDLSSLGHQPYHFENLTMVYNGEVYNHAEVRKSLEAQGYAFKSNTDTEVIIKNIHLKGITEALKDFVGMFAIALYDSNTSKLFLVRDRTGVKPLYYYWHDNLLLFASELKAFHQHSRFQKELNTDAVNLYLQHSYIPTPHTIYKKASKLRPGHFLQVDLLNQELEEKEYWNINTYFNAEKPDISYSEAKETLNDLMKSSFDYRLVSDVPVGVFLSGGYDSTAVASILQNDRTEKLKTFTIGFEEDDFNEAPHAKAIADRLGTDHSEFYCTHQEAKDIIPKLPFIFDEPFGDNSILPTVLISQMAVKEVTVALSADGGDEIFAGYPKHTNGLAYTQKFPQPIQKGLSKIMGLVPPKMIPFTKNRYNFDERYNKMKEIWASGDSLNAMKLISQFNTENTAKKWLLPDYNYAASYFDESAQLNNNSDGLNKMLAMDYKTFLLDNNLTKVDRATMSVGLEGREPLLDHRIAEFSAGLPSHFKYDGHTTKRILKDIVHDYVPKSVMDKPKMGFVVPIMDWFRNDLKDITYNYLDETKLNNQGLFNTKEVIKLRDNYLKGNAENVQRIWHLLVYQMWAEKWL